MGKEKRDEKGRIKDGLLTKIRSKMLARSLRKGRVPRGRSGKPVSMEDAQAALQDSFKGEFPEIIGMLGAKIHKANGEVIDLGLLSVKKVTTAFRDYIVDALQDSSTYPMDAFKYHGCGTGTTAEANTQTALVTEVGSRVAGTQIEGATANIYKSVATITPGGTYAITEHGLFSASSNGTMQDRSLFSAINVESSDSIEFTYECTFNAEA